MLALEDALGQSSPDAIAFSTGDGRASVSPSVYGSLQDAKPSTMLVRLLAKHLLQAADGDGGDVLEGLRGFFVGDRGSDLLCGMVAGLVPVLVLTGHGGDTLRDLESGGAEMGEISEIKSVSVSARALYRVARSKPRLDDREPGWLESRVVVLICESIRDVPAAVETWQA